MRKGLWVWVISGAILVGCGGVRPSPFTANIKPFAQQLAIYVKNKNLPDVEKAITIAEQRHSQKTMTSEEIKVVRAVGEYAKKDQWDAASKLLEDSLAMSK